MHIRVKITRDRSGRVVTMDLEDYLKGVVPSEIKAETCPMEAQRRRRLPRERMPSARPSTAAASPTTWTTPRAIRRMAHDRVTKTATQPWKQRAGWC